LCALRASAPAAASSNSLPPASVTATRAWLTRAVKQFFDWCDQHRLELHEIEAVTVAAYIEQLGNEASKPTVKQHLAAIRQLFDYLTTGGILEVNPAASVRGPKYVVKRGKTPVLSAEEARKLLDSIESNTLIGLRDRALIGTMVYSFAGRRDGDDAGGGLFSAPQAVMAQAP
jgi:integrase/recombinase XerD